MSTQKDTFNEPQVLIVGAGPVGLCLAHFLIKNSVSFRIIEKRTTINHYSRAFAIHSRTLEILNLIGVVEEMVATGRKLENLVATMYTDGKITSSIELPKPNSSQPFMCGLVQSETEKILEAKLNSLGYFVERGVELINVEFVDQVATSATIKKISDSSEEVVKFQYIVGCDGARSLVRKGAGIKFEGETVNIDLLCCDAKIDTDLSTIKFGNFFFKGDKMGGTINIKDDIVRLILPLREGEKEPNEAELFELFNHITAPHKFEVKESLWINTFRINERSASTHLLNNIILCGDAAHVHSPAGGQGMNTGIQDTFNLAWKLALQLKGQTKGKGLLETFASERKDIAKLVLANSGAMIRTLMTKPTMITHIQRQYLLPFAMSFESIRATASDQLSEVALEYNANLINDKFQSCTFSKALIKGVGLRIPCYPLLDLNNKELTTSHSFFNGSNSFQLLVFVPEAVLNLTHLPYLYNTFNQLTGSEQKVGPLDVRVLVQSQMFDWKTWANLQLTLNPDLSTHDQDKIKGLTTSLEQVDCYLDQTTEITNYFNLSKYEINFVVIRPDFHISKVFDKDANVVNLNKYFDTFLKL